MSTDGKEFVMVFTGIGSNDSWNIVEGSFTVPVARCGDLNDDGVMNVSDANIALQFAVGLVFPTEPQEVAGDLNGDGNITRADADVSLEHIVNQTSADGECGASS